jgi:hypothetical protein
VCLAYSFGGWSPDSTVKALVTLPLPSYGSRAGRKKNVTSQTRKPESWVGLGVGFHNRPLKNYQTVTGEVPWSLLRACPSALRTSH